MRYDAFKKLKKQMLDGPLSEKESTEEETETKAIGVAQQKSVKLKAALKTCEPMMKLVED